MKKYLLVMLLVVAGSALGQSVGGGFFVGLPQGDFKDEIDRAGYGLSVTALAFKTNPVRPVTFGVNVGYMVYGSVTERRPLSNTIREISVDVTQRNSLVNFHLLMQVSPFPGPVKPYLEFLGGGEYIFTTSEVESDHDYDDVFQSTNFDDFAWSYGAGFGIMFQLTDGIDGMGAVSLDLKTRYIFTTETEYLKEGDIKLGRNDNIYYTPSRSSTDVFSIQIGVMVGLR